MPKNRIAFVALGSNLKNRKKNIALSIKMLNAIPQTSVLKASALYETNPVGGPPQPKYMNGAVKIKTGLSASGLLCRMKKIEHEMGRPKNSIRNGPRIIDLDLLLFGNSIIKKRGLVVPHPRLHKRLFVLRPLSQIAGNIKHPILNKTVNRLLKEQHENNKGHS